MPSLYINNVSVSYCVVLMVTGAILLAAVYHTVLYAHNRLRIIGYYTVYLWSSLAYWLFRSIYIARAPELPYFVPDEVLQMISFALYIRFVKIAMELDPVLDKYSYTFCKIAPPVIYGYIAVSSVVYHLRIINAIPAGYILSLYIAIRVFLLFIGFIGLAFVFKKSNHVYYRYLTGGVLSIIVFGTLATVSEIFWRGNHYFTSLAMLALGYNIEVFFFSAAVSYKMRSETVEKEKANRRVLEQELILQKTKVEQMALFYKAKEEERSRIAIELHDEVGSTLSSISILSDVIINEKNNTSVRSMQHEIKANTRSVIEKMDDIIWSLNPRNDSLERMLLRIKQYATPLFEAKNIDYSYNFDEEVYKLPVPMEKRQQTYLIIKEAVNNMVKHSNCTIADVTVFYNNEDLVFTVKDNGKGFDTKIMEGGNGLFNMQHRARKIGATIEYFSEPQQQTYVRIKLNIG